MSDELVEGNNHPGIWHRGLYMLLFMLFYSVAEFVLTMVVLVQFGYRVFNERNQPRLLALGASLATYLYQLMRYLSFNSEQKPYPFSEWPEAGATSDDAA